tara:strand:+ start:63 stop:557 length:495 start_codon:yes stop_codon:yes gene_type:complete
MNGDKTMNLKNSRQTTLKEFGLVLLVAVMLSGCTGDIIPDPPTFDNRVAPNTTTLEGTFNVLIGDNNSTTPTIIIGNTTSWLEVLNYNYTATHLSFTVDNNTVTFHNYTFEVGGYVSQGIHNSSFLWNNGHAPSLGTAELHFSDFTYDVTINYTVTFREWRGIE